jgi:hypothetical protein
MEPIVFAETDGEVYDSGALRLRRTSEAGVVIADGLAPLACDAAKEILH